MTIQNSGRAAGGWALLAIALAVPGFLFFNWWSHLKAEHDRGLIGKASKSKTDKAIFQTAPTAPLLNPAAAKVPATPARVPTAEPVEVEASPSPAPAVEPPTKTPPDSETKPSGPQGESSATEVSVTLPRDPMMSPMDLVRLREDEIRRKEEADRIRRSAQDYNRARHQEQPIESSVVLQGIIASPGGAPLAIVNGSTVHQGEQFSVSGHSAKVKVLKIGAETVTFEYKRKRFNMTVSAE